MFHLVKQFGCRSGFNAECTSKISTPVASGNSEK